MTIQSYIICASIVGLFSACAEETVANETTKKIEETNSAIEENMKLMEQNDYSGGKSDTSARTNYSFHDSLK